MTCPGIVSHVASFGVFVDIGVRHDGLVHLSQLGPRHGARPLEPGDRVDVRVLKVDLAKKQISLTMRTPPASRRPSRGDESRERRAAPGDKAPPRASSARRPPRPPAPARPAGKERPAEPPAPPAAVSPPRPAGPRPSGARPRPATAPRPESRRPAFNNPFAVLAGLKVPPKKG
jgi:predicted RNA-binding protein with RPS1 domain